MSISILYPFLYMLAGVIFALLKPEMKTKTQWLFSALLTWIVIPVVIIDNILFHEAGIFTIMLSMMAIMAIMLYSCLYFTRDAIKSLCFCYLNIGWLALPLALALYGDKSALIIIAAYVGSSVFGNAVSVSLFAHGANRAERLIKTFRSPPVLSVLTGLALMPVSPFIQPVIFYPYQISKMAMRILGMFILGMWIASSKWCRMQDLWISLWLAAFRFTVFSILISAVVAYGFYCNIPLIKDNIKVFYFIGLLPPAANIVVLETYYLKTGRSTALISIGTFISIAAILIYAAFTV